MTTTRVETELLRILESLPPSAQNQVLDFARYLQRRKASSVLDRLEHLSGIELHATPADTLLELAALVALGGDAIADAEALYDANNDHR